MKRLIESPFAKGKAVLKIKPKKRAYRKEEFEVYDYYYVCQVTGKEFTTPEAGDATMNQLYNQYREMHNMMFPVELKQLRERYALSPSKMSEVLGFGINVYRDYERGEIPNRSNANMLELIKNPKNFFELAQESGLLSETELDALNKKVKHITKRSKGEVIRNYVIHNKEINQFTGFIRNDFEKLASMVLFFLWQNDRTYKTRLNKYLFYADFLCYKYTCRPMSGYVYCAIDKGPVPDFYEVLYYELEKNDFIDSKEIELNGNESIKFEPKKKFDDTKFTEEEYGILKDILEKLQFKKTDQIIKDSHKLKGWLDNIETKSAISYQKYAYEIEL